MTAPPLDSGRRTPAAVYRQLEQQITDVLLYGPYLINESALAQYFDVGRPAAHHMLSHLENVGLASQDTNRRWYSKRLTRRAVQEHYEVRWLLEPTAIVAAAAHVSMTELERKRTETENIAGETNPLPKLRRVEWLLHHDVLRHGWNAALRGAVWPSQLVTCGTLWVPGRHESLSELHDAAAEHCEIYDQLLAGDSIGAGAAMESHLRKSWQRTINIFDQRRQHPSPKDLPAYLSPGSS